MWPSMRSAAQRKPVPESGDQSYWDSFYSTARPGIVAPSTFAQHCAPFLPEAASLFELGCGNGRDVHYFAGLGHRVIACDRSSVAIEELAGGVSGCGYRHQPELVVGEMGSLPAREAPLDAVYSRFTLHAVDVGEASRALRWAYDNLAVGGQFLAEARSVKGSLYGKGVEVARDTFLYNDHTRRFLRLDELLAELGGLGFTIVDHSETDGVAVHKDDDPVVIRVVARK